jgi:hypothetical protein
MKSAIACIVLLCAGCATAPSGPTPIATSTKTVSVDKATAVPCVELADVPQIPAAIELPPDLITCDTVSCVKRKVVALAASKKALDKYAELADAVLQQCVKGKAIQ